MKANQISPEQSAGLNLNTAKTDVEWAIRHLEVGEFGQSLEYIRWAMSQLESATEKLSKKKPK